MSLPPLAAASGHFYPSVPAWLIWAVFFLCLISGVITAWLLKHREPSPPDDPFEGQGHTDGRDVTEAVTDPGIPQYEPGTAWRVAMTEPAPPIVARVVEPEVAERWFAQAGAR